MRRRSGRWDARRAIQFAHALHVELVFLEGDLGAAYLQRDGIRVLVEEITMDDLSRALEDDLIVAAPGGRCKQQDDEPSAEAHGADYTQTFRPLAEGLSKTKRTAVGFPRRLSLDLR